MCVPVISFSEDLVRQCRLLLITVAGKENCVKK